MIIYYSLHFIANISKEMPMPVTNNVLRNNRLFSQWDHTHSKTCHTHLPYINIEGLPFSMKDLQDSVGIQ